VRALVVSLVVALLGCGRPAAATTLQGFDLAGLVDRSARIVAATCQRVTPEVMGGQPVTRYGFAVRQFLKGEGPAALSVVLPGGEQAGTTVRWVGMPVFAPGEEVILFLTGPDQVGAAWPVGLAQGAFRIERQDDRLVVRQQLDGVGLTWPSGTGAAKPTIAERLDGLPLADFLVRVRARVRLADPAHDPR
jgi:hypothetical protein